MTKHMTKIKPKTDSSKKYLIEKLIEEKLDRGITQEQFLYYVRQNGVSRTSFFRDKRIELTNDECIPEHRLQVYAKALDVEIFELLNYEVIQRPVNDIHFETQQKKKASPTIAQELNLSK